MALELHLAATQARAALSIRSALLGLPMDSSSRSAQELVAEAQQARAARDDTDYSSDTHSDGDEGEDNDAHTTRLRRHSPGDEGASGWAAQPLSARERTAVALLDMLLVWALSRAMGKPVRLRSVLAPVLAAPVLFSPSLLFPQPPLLRSLAATKRTPLELLRRVATLLLAILAHHSLHALCITLSRLFAHRLSSRHANHSQGTTEALRARGGVHSIGAQTSSEQRCAICLIASSSTARLQTSLETFCETCKTPLHAKCAFQWWRAVQRANKRRRAVRAPLTLAQIAELAGIPAQLAIRSASGDEGTNATAEERDDAGEQGLPLRLAHNGPCGLGPLEGAIVSAVPASRSHGEGADASSKRRGVWAAIDSDYLAARAQARSNEDGAEVSQDWAAPFESSEARERVRTQLRRSRERSTGNLATSGQRGEFVVARLESCAPGPTCPVCRSPLLVELVLATARASSQHAAVATEGRSRARCVLQQLSLFFSSGRSALAQVWHGALGRRALLEMLACDGALGMLVFAVTKLKARRARVDGERMLESLRRHYFETMADNMGV